MRSVPITFVAKELPERPPAAITNRLGKAMIFEHPTDIKVLDLDMPVLVYKLPTQLMQKVFTLTGYLFVHPGHLQSGLVTPLATFFAATKTALQTLKSTLGRSQILRVVYLFACAEYGKMLKAKVNAKRWPFVGWLRYFYLTLNRDEILTALGFRDGTVFHLAFKGAVEDGTYPTDFGQKDTATLYLEILGVTDRLRMVLAFEVRIFCAAFKEVHKGAVKVFERLLQHLSSSLFKPRRGAKFLEQGKHLAQVIVVNTFAIFGIVGLSSSQPPIVNETGMAELNRQGRLLFGIRIDAVLKCLFDFHRIKKHLEAFAVLYHEDGQPRRCLM